MVKMKVRIEKDYNDLSKVAGKILIDAISKNPEIVLGLATGSTPMGMYQEIIKAHKENNLDFSNVKSFNLDEYVGLSGDNSQSYEYFMKKNFFNHINIKRENIFVPDGKAENLEQYCKKYDEMIENAGGIDIQILGVGENGHIAFNEPDHYLFTGTSVVNLTKETVKVNSRFFENAEEVPSTAITMGMGGILKAKKIILLANGKRKKHVIQKLLNENKVSTMFPVSFLLLHPDVTVIVDKEAYE